MLLFDPVPDRPPLRDTCGWCIVGKHPRCERVYVYERHTVRCVCAENLHGILNPPPASSPPSHLGAAGRAVEDVGPPRN
jgi:hypothetical protein